MNAASRIARQNWFRGLLLLVLTAAAYQPVWHAGFIWDDADMVTENRFVQAGDGLRAIWFSTALPDYFPMTSTVFWVQWRLWGSHPLGYHLVNVLLHAVSAWLSWQVLLRLKIPGAWLAAALFALHPVNVESVAWISELKNTLAMFFFALTLLAYLKAHEPGNSKQETGSAKLETRNANPGVQNQLPCAFRVSHSEFHRGWYLAGLLAFVLALLSKTAVAPLPLVLLGIAWWQRGRLARRDLWRTAPFFAAAALLALVTIWFQYHRSIGANVVRDDVFMSRLAGAGWAIWFYLWKVVWPTDLMMIYPLWKIDPGKVMSHVPGALALGALLVCWQCRRSWGRPWFFALAYFVVMLLPVLGFLNIAFMRFSLVADRWQYFAILGPLALAAAALAKCEARNSKHGANPDAAGQTFVASPFALRISNFEFRVPRVIGAALLITLGALTWNQCRMYTDLKTLWQTTVARNPDCAVAQVNLGDLLFTDGKIDDAIARYRRALAARPDYADGLNNLGTALLRKGRADEAIGYYQKAVELRPRAAEYRYNLANALLESGRTTEAILQYQKTLELEPGHLMANNNLGNVYRQEGRLDEAALRYRKALETRMDFAAARHNLGMVLLVQGQTAEAVAQFRKIVESQPGNAKVHNNLGWMLREAGRLDEAVLALQKALELHPDYPEAHGNLAKTLRLRGDDRQAAAEYRTALRGQPEDMEYLSDLAWLLAASPDASVRNGAEALELAQCANRVSGGQDPAILRVLAAALAERGRFTEAIEAVAQALRSAESHSNAALVELLRTELRQYQAGATSKPEHSP